MEIKNNPYSIPFQANVLVLGKERINAYTTVKYVIDKGLIKNSNTAPPHK